MNNYKFKAKPELVNEMIKPIISSLEENDVSFKAVHQTNLVLEEILVNVSKYAYEGKDGDVEISYEIKDNSLSVEIKDKGIEFNPLEHDDPDLSAPAKDRKIGGLGIFIVKNLVDNIEYKRVNDENVLRFNKNIVR